MSMSTFLKNSNNLYFEFQLIDICNWNCSYCNYTSSVCDSSKTIENINKLKDNLSNIKSVLDILQYYTNIHLLAQGGEIGLVSKEVLSAFFGVMYPYTFTISTNGEFLKREYHIKYGGLIRDVHFHIAEDVKDNYDKELWYPKDIDTNNKIIPGVVSTIFDISTIEKFINNNPKLKYLDFEYPLGKPITEEEYNKIISCRVFLKENYNYLYDNCERNIMPFSELVKNQQGCSKCNRIITFDLVNERICLCSVKNRHISIKLTRENLVKLLTEINVYDLSNTNCSSCVRTCFSFDSKYIQDTMKLKNTLKRKLKVV